MVYSPTNRGAEGAAETIAPQRLQVSAGGRQWVLERVGDLEARWAALGNDEFGDDERIPYWCELWPASFLLVDWLQRHAGQVKGKTCLDLGCGLGLTALAGARLGAKVLAMDYEPEALEFAARNAELNNAPGILWSAMDWRAPAIRPGSIDLAWGGDIVYERRFREPLAAMFQEVLAPGGRVWLAEPVRSVSAPAWEWLADQGFAVHKLTTEKVPTEGYEVTVNLWELQKGE